MNHRLTVVLERFPIPPWTGQLADQSWSSIVRHWTCTPGWDDKLSNMTNHFFSHCITAGSRQPNCLFGKMRCNLLFHILWTSRPSFSPCPYEIVAVVFHFDCGGRSAAQRSAAAKQSKAKQRNATQRNATQRKAKQSKAKQSKAKHSTAQQSKAKQSKARSSRFFAVNAVIVVGGAICIIACGHLFLLPKRCARICFHNIRSDGAKRHRLGGIHKMSPHHQCQIIFITHCMVLAHFVTRIAIALAFCVARAKLWKFVFSSRFASFPVAGAALCCVASSIVVAGVGVADFRPIANIIIRT